MIRLIIITVILFALTLAWGIGLVWPRYQNLVILNKRNEIKSADLQRKEENLQELKKISQILKNYQPQLAKIDFALPASLDLPTILGFLQKASSQSGLVLIEIKSLVSRPITEKRETSQPPSKIREASQPEELKETELSFIVSGDYSSFKNFLSLLERNARLFEVEAISFTFPGKEKPWNFDLKIKVYSY